MDPLSIAASIVGFISLSASVLAAFDKLPGDKEVRTKVGMIRDEVNMIATAARNMDVMLKRVEREVQSILSETPVWEQLQGILIDCCSICQKLDDALMATFPDIIETFGDADRADG